ncbi:hypothetical protein [Paramagnetospirillum kuznetsovii]|uniref:hypothetical protein n=1 Tax=Paramagnetospirillum kuznetsovii TaxID=2053833 RepID=UPI0011BDA9A0|nr:hypothetical protein [Paramagnetospirillum kuznetsovii]
MDIVGVSRSDVFSSTTTSLSSSRESASASNTTTSTATEVYYSSPVFRQDALTGALIEVWRNTTTGEQISQSPSRAALLYGKTQDRGATEAQSTGSSNGPSTAANSQSRSGYSSGSTVSLLA